MNLNWTDTRAAGLPRGRPSAMGRLRRLRTTHRRSRAARKRVMGERAPRAVDACVAAPTLFAGGGPSPGADVNSG